MLAGPPYSTAADVQAATRVWQPGSVKQWLSFECQAAHTMIDAELVTSLAFRLTDGTDEYYWDGGAWAVSTTEWNTEAEIAANIATFPVAPRSLGVIVNLRTTNATATPRVRELKVLWSSDVEFLEDVIYRSLVPSLRENVRPIARLLAAPGVETSTIDLNDYPMDVAYNIADVVGVYNRNTDPNRQTDLLQSYDTGTKIITLSSPLPAGDIAHIRFTYEPEVAVTTSAEYSEIAKIPALVLADIDFDASRGPEDDWIVSKADGSAVRSPAPYMGDLVITMHMLTDKAIDLHRLHDEVLAYFENNRELRSTALDRAYTLWLTSEYDMRTAAGSADQHTGRVRFRIRNVACHVRDSVDQYGVQRFRVTGTEAFTVAES